jgi:hypothetical protein
MNQKTKRLLRRFGCTAVFLFALAIPAPTSAQNCALCYTQAAGSGSRMIQALKSGILFLVVPPMLICIGITVMAYRKRNLFNEEIPDRAAREHTELQAQWLKIIKSDPQSR